MQAGGRMSKLDALVQAAFVTAFLPALPGTATCPAAISQVPAFRVRVQGSGDRRNCGSIGPLALPEFIWAPG